MPWTERSALERRGMDLSELWFSTCGHCSPGALGLIFKGKSWCRRGLTLTPALGKFSETLDGQLIKTLVVEENKEGMEAPQEMERSRDGTRVQPSCIFFHFQCNFCHCIYSKGSQPGWAPGETNKATVD